MAAYEFDGEKYKQASKHQKEWGNHLISQLHLNGTETVLDLGCGDGALSEQIAQLVPKGRVLGIDASYGMLQTAKKLECDNLSFIQMDINNMKFSNEFDIIFSNAALHWVLDHSSLLKRSFCALKQGGSIHWNFAGYGTCSAFYDVVHTKMKYKQYAHYFNDFIWPWFMPSKEQYKDLIEPIGFSKIEIVEESKDRYFSDADEMIKWIDQPSIVPFITCIPDNMKDSFRKEVIQLMLEKTTQKDGTCFETFRRINVTAIK